MTTPTRLLMLLLLALCSQLQATEVAATALISGHQYQHHSSQLAAERRYLVSLPERYHIGDDRYPSLYIIDADFQFQHVAATVKHLARMGKLPPMIVIGVANQGTNDYLRTTTWPDGKDEAFGGAAQFQAYLAQELVPLIDHSFRTNGQKALAGYSLGGLFTLYSMMQPQTPFNAFLAMSPSAWFDNNSLPGKLTPLLKQRKLTAPVFLSVAREEGMGVDKLVEVFEQSAPESLKWQFRHYPEENHFTTALPALYDGLQFLAPGYATDGTDMLAIGDYTKVLAHFDKLDNQWGGFNFGWLQAYQFAKYLSWSKQTDQVDAVLDAIEVRFPREMPLVAVHIAHGFNKKKQYDRALKVLDRVSNSGRVLPGWHRQMALYAKGINDPKRAEHHQQRALKLAKQYQLASWEIWELQ